MRYFQTDDRDDYFASLGGNNIRVKPTFEISLDGVVAATAITSQGCRKFVRDNLGLKDKFLKDGKWKQFLLDAGYQIVNLKSGEQIMPEKQIVTKEQKAELLKFLNR